jgi:hypothetical protein
MSARGIVELCWGPQQGAKAIVTPGRPLTLGRDPAASLVLDDPTVAPVHAAVEWDGSTARLRHLGGPALTLLSGQAVTTVAPLEHAAWIRIGGTDLSFHVEALTPAPWSREPDDEVAAEAALAHLQRVPGPLFAVLDTACEPRIASRWRRGARCSTGSRAPASPTPPRTWSRCRPTRACAPTSCARAGATAGGCC